MIDLTCNCAAGAIAPEFRALALHAIDCPARASNVASQSGSDEPRILGRSDVIPPKRPVPGEAPR